MPYLSITDFKQGMDRRRPQDAGSPGTLYVCKNALISRGGDVVRAKKFDSRYTLPTGTFGLYGIKGQLFVFGSGTEPSGMPVGVQYQQLAAPSTPSMTAILDVKSFDGKLYAVAEYDDGSIYHFYDGSRVTDWDALADANSGFNTVAERLALKVEANAGVSARAYSNVIEITAQVAGTAFTLGTAVVNNGGTPTAVAAAVQANVAAVAEVVSTGTVTVTDGSSQPGVSEVEQITVNGVNLLAAPVNWISSNSATANAVAAAINNRTATTGYRAAAVSAVITISAAAGTGATPNGYVVTVDTGGTVSATKTNMAGGVTAVTAVAQVSTVTISGSSYDATDSWTVTIDATNYLSTGRASGTGTSVFVHKRRVWSTAGSLFQYCKLNDPSDWDDATASTGSGFLNMSSESEGSQRLVGAAAYQSYAAIFSRDNILIYSLSTDDTGFAIVEPLESTGSMAAGSISPYGNNDVFYLDDTGIRSIRTRDGHDAAFVEDVGSAIDPFVQELMADTDEETLSHAKAVVERLDGRYMLAIGSTLIVLSRFPSSKITAWSYLEPGFEIEHMARTQRDIYLRSGDTIYQYGGATGTVYPDADEQVALVETVFMSANDPAGKKGIQGFDMACQGVWNVKVLVDPTDTSKFVEVGNVHETTYHKEAIEVPGDAALLALRMTCSAAGFASVSSVALHYVKEGAA